MKPAKSQILNQHGESVEAAMPIIISASRSTDIPAFYADWFIHRLKTGYVKWTNPFNQVPLYVSFEKARLIVFWTKNPKPMLQYLDYLEDSNLNYYFQFTLNDYDNEKLEPNVPKVEYRIETFQKLAEKIGKEKVIWRFDPLILTDKIGVDELLRKVENIGNQLKNYTEKLVFSFADINLYKKVENNLRKNNVKFIEFDEKTMTEFALGLQIQNNNWNFELATCAEKIELEKYQIDHNKCIDDDLMIKLFPNDSVLMDFLGVKIEQNSLFDTTSIITKTKINKDKGQRLHCGCVPSKDIGEYNTCPHLCEYCYANANKDIALKNWNWHKENRNGETIK